MEQKLMQLQAKIEEDRSIGERLFTLETADEVQAFLNENGLEFSLDEIGMMREAMLKLAEQGQAGELSDEDLDDVAGGFAITAAVVGATASVIGATFSAGTFTHTVTRGRW